MTTRHYCTYLDHNYVPRVLLLADSLRRHGGDFRLHVLCLSELCGRILGDLALPEVTLIALADVERRYPALLDVKPARSTVEYYFTLTPFLPAYCLAGEPGLDEITYLDSDLYFFADPQAIFDIIGARSIGIVPQHLSPYWSFAATFGRFNVGWITYRRTAQGTACLEAYCRDCLEWCYERLEGDRYSDQKYLDRWPAAYADLAVIEHKGVNVASYNADAYAIAERDGRLWCDDQPLLFYHFHGVYQDTDGNYAVVFPIEHGKREGAVVRRIYRPYVARLIEQRQLLLRRFPELAGAAPVARILPIDPVKASDLAQWGADALVRLALAHAVELRERARHGEWPHDPTLRHFMDFADVLVEASKPAGALTVLDWAGGFGEFHWCARALWPDLPIAWHVRELSAVCDHGAAVFAETRFHDDDAAAFARRYDVVLASGALHHAADWRAVLGRLAAAAGQFLVILDLPVSESGAALFIQERPLAFLPGAAFATPVLPLPAVLQQLAAAGWTPARELAPSFAPPVAGSAPPVVYKSLVFRRTS
jgi:putative methyltransferase (TIGR04325 family)